MIHSSNQAINIQYPLAIAYTIFHRLRPSNYKTEVKMMPQAARLTESSLAEFTTPTEPY